MCSTRHCLYTGGKLSFPCLSDYFGDYIIVVAVLPFRINPVADFFIWLEGADECVDAVEPIFDFYNDLVFIGATLVASD